MPEVRPDLWPLLDRGAPVSPVWETDAFADEMRSWCRQVLDRDVQLEVQKIRGWSAVWRVTDGRDVWFATHADIVRRWQAGELAAHAAYMSALRLFVRRALTGVLARVYDAVCRLRGA